MTLALATALLPAISAQACQTALLLALDVSNSIDPGEYSLQTDGLAAALRDPVIVEDLVAGQVALSVVQWSGFNEQHVSIPWRQMHTPADVEAIAQQAETMTRAFVSSNTAVGSFIDFAIRHLTSAPTCARHVIDISGDGQDNAGGNPRKARGRAEKSNIQINGLAINGGGRSVTNYFRDHVRTRDGFVMSARGYRDYPRALRAKMRREISQVLF